MSHYTVAVITKDGDYESVLAPYDEELRVEPYIEKTKAEIIVEMKNFVKINKGAEWLKENNLLDKNGNLDEEALYQYYRKDEEETGYVEFDEEGNQLTTYNPDSKWDWYQVGGRWDGAIMHLKDGTFVNHAQVKDIDFSPAPLDEAEAAYFKRFWEINVEGAEPDNDTERGRYVSIYNKNYYLERFGTLENFISFQQSFYTHAFVLDGEWYECGKMGWFGMDDSTKDSTDAYREKLREVLSKLDPEDYITIVDCHI